jgi:hypothetical protein
MVFLQFASVSTLVNLEDFLMFQEIIDPPECEQPIDYAASFEPHFWQRFIGAAARRKERVLAPMPQMMTSKNKVHCC